MLAATPLSDHNHVKPFTYRQLSTYVRAAHQLQGRLDVPPGFSLFALTLFLAVASL
jgi:hypothetical protein